MPACHATLPAKHKTRTLYDGSNGVSHGCQSGINTICIAKPFAHPLDLAASLEAAKSGHQTKCPHYNKITWAQFSASEEQAKQEAAAQKAGEYSLTTVST
jgi:hypothetical protein